MKAAVIGAGTMGSGIAQVCAMSGHDVGLFDSDPAKFDQALASMKKSLERLVVKGKISDSDSDLTLRRVHRSQSLVDACSNAEVVVESVIENLEAKRRIFQEVVQSAPKHSLLGTNTSQLSITSIGSAIEDDSDRLVGLHFFNPPVLMRLVEIVCGLNTSKESLQRSLEFAQILGKETVVCHKDSPGFLTSRISAIVRLECLRMLEEGVGTASDIDKALKLGLNFPMGPLELGDFNGLDTYLSALNGLADAYGDRFRAPVTLRNLVAAGRLGRKTGWGIYRYAEDGSKIDDVDE